MAKRLLNYCSILLLLVAVSITQLNCKTTHANKIPSQQIPGLYIGTYTVGEGEPVPAKTSFYFSFSIYPDGKLSYKSKGYYEGSREYISFADGTWSLKGNTFSFTVTTANYAGGGNQHVQSGTASYNSKDGTLTNGYINDPQGGSAKWSMKKIK